jgi:hypothetical protein
MLGSIEGQLGRVYGGGAYAGGPTYRAVAEHRQALPERRRRVPPKAPDVRDAATLDPLTGRGRHARTSPARGRARGSSAGLRSAAGVDVAVDLLAAEARARCRAALAQPRRATLEAGIAVQALEHNGSARHARALRIA